MTMELAFLEETYSKWSETGLDPDEDKDRKLSQTEARAQSHGKTFSMKSVVFIVSEKCL